MAICGVDCCKDCGRFQDCGGCETCGGHPFGSGTCVAAEAIKSSGAEEFAHLKQDIINEINALDIPELHVDDLNLLNGFYVNLEYPTENGTAVKYLNNDDVYFGNQIERENNERCYGVVANKAFILVCEYGCNGADPVLILYKRRLP